MATNHHTDPTDAEPPSDTEPADALADGVVIVAKTTRNRSRYHTDPNCCRAPENPVRWPESTARRVELGPCPYCSGQHPAETATDTSVYGNDPFRTLEAIDADAVGDDDTAIRGGRTDD